MSCHTHAHSTSAPPVSSLTPETKNLLQRKCACGGVTKLSGPCEACSSKQFEPKKRSPLGHDFSKVRVHGNSARPASAGFTLQPAITHEPAEEETEKEEYSTAGIRMTLAGSGTCQNGGAASGCNPDNGVYEIKRNNNTCCTKPCSVKHEQTHINDITGWGCCAALSTAYNKPGADKNAAVQKYNDWLAKVYDITECNSLTAGVACATEMFTAKDCSGAGKDTDCCKDIVDYKANFGGQKTTVCGRAPKKVEPCPTF
jgi:hypothetical protein